MIVRFAKPEDINAIIELCELHAAFEKAAYNTLNKTKILVEHLFGSHPVLKCLVVEAHNKIFGYATFMKQFSTWNADFYIYLDCLFLKEETRGRGVGIQIMDAIKLYATSENCKTIEWQTPYFNDGAIKFYKRLGAQSKSKERFFWAI